MAHKAAREKRPPVHEQLDKIFRMADRIDGRLDMMEGAIADAINAASMAESHASSCLMRVEALEKEHAKTKNVMLARALVAIANNLLTKDIEEIENG